MTTVRVVTEFNSQIIRQRLEWSPPLDNPFDQLTWKIIRHQDEGVRQALIALGWTPPPEKDCKMNLKVKKLHPDAILPAYQSAGAACFDLHCYAPGLMPTVMGPNASGATFRTGLAFEIPPGWAMLIYSRSGHGFNHDVRLANCVGVIDSDYRGEVAVRLSADCNDRPLVVGHGVRIAQAMLIQAPQVQLVEVDELSTTVRGDGGFGSTGA